MVSKVRRGNSLAVQWLGVGTFTARAWVQSLVRELRSRKPQKGAAKKKKKKSGEWLPFIGVGGSEGGSSWCRLHRCIHFGKICEFF